LPSTRGPLYKLIQLKGPYNAEVPQEIEQAIRAFISGLNETARAVE
jgi:hypothetical protein